MNQYQKRKERERRQAAEERAKHDSKIWNKHGLTYRQYRTVYAKWHKARQRGHNVSLEFYLENRHLQICLWRKTKVYRLKSSVKKFGLTVEQYKFIYDSQKGKCAICGDKEGKKNFSIDHDHKTGKVRGLLCNNCNSGIGYLRDNVKIIFKAAEYIKKHSQENPIK